MSVDQEVKYIKQIVMKLLNEDERCRNSDLWLILKLWQQEQHIKIYIPFNKVLNGELANFETISRVRRHIQHDMGKYPPTDPKVIKQRKIREQEHEEYWSEVAKMKNVWDD